MLHSYLPFTIHFAVTIQYKNEEADHYHSSTNYVWYFRGYLQYQPVIINTTSPLLNYTFDHAGSYHYELWVHNVASTFSKEGDFIGYYFVRY